MDYRYMESPLGRLLLAGDQGRLHCIGLPDGKGRAAHGLAGGVMSVLQGGKFGHGFVSAGLAQGLSGKINGIDRGTRFSAKRIMAAALAGGTASAVIQH